MSLPLAWLVECIPTHIITLTGKILEIEFDEKKVFGRLEQHVTPRNEGMFNWLGS